MTESLVEVLESNCWPWRKIALGEVYTGRTASPSRNGS